MKRCPNCNSQVKCYQSQPNASTIDFWVLCTNSNCEYEAKLEDHEQLDDEQ